MLVGCICSGGFTNTLNIHRDVVIVGVYPFNCVHLLL